MAWKTINYQLFWKLKDWFLTLIIFRGERNGTEIIS